MLKAKQQKKIRKTMKINKKKHKLLHTRQTLLTYLYRVEMSECIKVCVLKCFWKDIRVFNVDVIFVSVKTIILLINDSSLKFYVKDIYVFYCVLFGVIGDVLWMQKD